MAKYIIRCNPEHIILAARVVTYGETKMPNDSAIVSYGESPNSVVFYVKKTPTGLSVRQDGFQ